MAIDDAKEKLEQLNQKFKEAKLWVKKNPKKTAAAIATIVIITAIAIKKMRENKPQYKTFPENTEKTNPVVNPVKQEEIVIPATNNSDTISQSFPISNNSGYSGYYSDLNNPNTDGLVNDDQTSQYGNMGFLSKLGNEITDAKNEKYNNLAGTINPKQALWDNQ